MNCGHRVAGFNFDRLDAARPVEHQAIPVNGINEISPPDQYYWSAGPSQHSAKIAADGPGSDHGDSRPFLRRAHVDRLARLRSTGRPRMVISRTNIIEQNESHDFEESHP